MDGLKPWVCRKCSAVLGQVKRNGRGVRHLMLYRHAVNLKAESPAEVEVIGYLEGTMTDIVCDVCGAVRTWAMGQEALEKAVRKYLAE